MRGIVSNALPAWDGRYPAQAALRREIAAIAEVFVDALFAFVGRDGLQGIYLKGSSQKVWDSPIDYVPEMSDVDIHVLFTDDGREIGMSLETGLTISAALEEGYRRRIPDPIHVPRVQMVVANTLHSDPDFGPSPQHTVRTLWGKPYPTDPIDPERSRSQARKLMLEHEEHLGRMGERVSDRTGRHLWEILRPMGWRVSPTGPRVLELRGVPYVDAWGVNRTAIVRSLQGVGEGDLADDYSAFYLHTWQYVLSGHEDGEAGRRAIEASVRVLRRGIAVAREEPLP
jgi:hypothetical protein